MHKNLIRVGICAALALAGTTASAACYTVYNSRGRMVVREPNPPVNMAQHLRHTVPRKYGRGSTMVFEAPAGSACTDYSAARANQRRHTTQDTEAILNNLARLHEDPRGKLKGRSDAWLADVDF